MANIAQGEACYICHKTLTKSCILSYKRSGNALSVLLYFKLKDVLTEDIPLKFNTFINESTDCNYRSHCLLFHKRSTDWDSPL